MNLFLKLHQLAAERGDGLRSEFFDLFTRTTCADTMMREPPNLTVVQTTTEEATDVVPKGSVAG